MSTRGRARFGGDWHGKDSFELVAVSANVLASHVSAGSGSAGRGSVRRGFPRTLLSWWRFPRMSRRGEVWQGLAWLGEV
jgi:hypothetical protein